MPRKKLPQPNPTAVFEYPDLTVEVYDDANMPRGRGLHNKNRATDRETRAASLLAELHYSIRPSDQQKLKKYLINATAFANELIRSGAGDANDRALRRTAARAIQLFKGLVKAQKSQSK